MRIGRSLRTYARPRQLSFAALLTLTLGMFWGWPNAAWAQQPSLHPRVLGFERFFTNGAAANPGNGAHNPVEGGLLLLGELNCTSCHKPEESHSMAVVKKQAPILDEVGSRVQPAYLAKFLANPSATKPGTTMPNVFAGLPPAEAQSNAEALAHFLATTGKLAEGNPSRQTVIRGEAAYHAVGCVVCHGPRKEDSKPQDGLIPLGTPSKKYTYEALTKFLEDPLHVRPSGRMPNPNLTKDMASDVAAFLLGDTAGPSGLDYAYYEGSWDKLPDFSKLTPKESGAAEKIDLALIKRRDGFALRFDGFIQIAKEGDYTFFIHSDDGSRLAIDGRVVVNNDGIHPAEEKSGKTKLTAGKHAILVEYFEQAGGEELKVEIEGPELSRRNVNEVLASPEKKPVADAPKPWVVDAKLAEKGKQIFASAGCAACHQLKQQDNAIASTVTAKNLAALGAEGGCLSASPTGKSPAYSLNAAQKTAIAAALADLKKPLPSPQGEQLVHSHLLRFNCYGCHNRGEVGGVTEATNEWFTTTMKEIGDEGRIPPHLTLVGAKLKDEWLKTVVEEGAKVRPYMLTHMPKFGAANVGSLVKLLATADEGKVPATPKTDADEKDRRFKASGRFIVGAQGVGCIKCHTFNNKGTPGIQVMDLTTMTKRLREDWYYHYMLNPPAYRPGTRMPAAWPGGQTVLPKVLGGDTPKQIVSTWAYLSDGTSAQGPVGMVEAAIELLPIDEPLVYRNFIEGAGPRAIAVGFPQKLNYAWDADHMRLALLWQGAFIDASMHWVGRGPGFQKPLGEPVAQLPADAPLALLDSATAAWPTTTDRNTKDPHYKFHGYHLDAKRIPTFRYTFADDVQVHDTPVPKLDGEIAMIARTLTFESAKSPANLYFLAGAGAKIEAIEKGWYLIGDALRVHVDASQPATIRDGKGRKELLVPVKFDSGKATIALEYEW